MDKKKLTKFDKNLKKILKHGKVKTPDKKR